MGRLQEEILRELEKRVSLSCSSCQVTHQALIGNNMETAVCLSINIKSTISCAALQRLHRYIEAESEIGLLPSTYKIFVLVSLCSRII